MAFADLVSSQQQPIQRCVGDPDWQHFVLLPGGRIIGVTVVPAGEVVQLH